MIENNQSMFTITKKNDDFNFRVAKNVIQIDRRRQINFDILQNDQNNIDSNFDSLHDFDFLHVLISIKRVLKNIIITINNQFAKKKKTFQKHEKQIAF